MLSARIQDSEVPDLEIRQTLDSKRGAVTQGHPWRNSCQIPSAHIGASTTHQELVHFDIMHFIFHPL